MALSRRQSSSNKEWFVPQTEEAGGKDDQDGGDDIASSIAAAVEEQTATTSDIAGNIAQASAGVQEVTKMSAQSSMVAASITEDCRGQSCRLRHDLKQF